MGKKYLRIANRNPESARGFFPRRLLQVMGATTNRDKKDTDRGAPQFGSGKKLAPVAALKLGMEAHITSHDRQGPYFYRYGSEPDDSLGEEPQDVLTMTGHDGEVVRTDIAMHSAKNWTESIGDDPVREYHVLREYVQDAYALDPGFRPPVVTDILTPAIAGTTSAYLTYTEGIAHVLAHPERYFKYLSEAKPILSLPAIGCVYPKSEEGMTRIFGKGQLASCSKSVSESSAYDYSLDKLSLMSEDRTFRSMHQVKRQIGLLLGAVDSEYMAGHLIDEMLAGRARLESASLQTLRSDHHPPGAAAWRKAWQSLCPERDVVMSSFLHMYDEYARYSCGKEVVTVTDQGLQKILGLCGVKYAAAFYPEHRKNAEIITPAPEQQANVDTALRMLARLRLVHSEYETFVYRPLVATRKNPDLGFCLTEGDGKGTYLLEKMTDVLRDAIETSYHEHAHARTGGAEDGSRAFDGRKDEDVGRLVLIIDRLFVLLISMGMEEEDILARIDDLLREEERKDADPDPIDRMIDKADPEPPKK